MVGNGDVAAQEATQHLIESGSRRIAFVGGPNHLDMVRRRKHGYLEALRENRIAIDRSLVVCDKIDYQDIIYYAAPKQKELKKSMDEVDPELLATFDKLGIPLREQKALAGVAYDAIMDSVSVKTTPVKSWPLIILSICTWKALLPV